MMDRNHALDLLDEAIAGEMPPVVKREVQAAAHKLRFPMADILARVPGDSVSERARRIGVSRQTLYIWAAERFRPTAVQAKRIAKLSGVPLEQIVDDGFEADPTRPTASKTRRRRSGKVISRSTRK